MHLISCQLCSLLFAAMANFSASLVGFNANRMPISQIYHPLLIRALVDAGGVARAAVGAGFFGAR